jgi:hypothetical protein
VVARHLLKHPIDHADTEVHMTIQAEAKTVDEGCRTDSQSMPPTFATPGLWFCRLCAMTRRKIRSTMFTCRWQG